MNLPRNLYQVNKCSCTTKLRLVSFIRENLLPKTDSSRLRNVVRLCCVILKDRVTSECRPLWQTLFDGILLNRKKLPFRCYDTILRGSETIFAVASPFSAFVYTIDEISLVFLRLFNAFPYASQLINLSQSKSNINTNISNHGTLRSTNCHR